jgi:hypothetical protein
MVATSFLFGCSAYRVYQPKSLNVSGDYYHDKTGIEFPENFSNFSRESITSFSKDSTNIGVTYNFDNLKQDPKLTIYIYPAPVAIEHRMRNEYLECLQAIANVSNQGINTAPKHIRVVKDGYKVLGLSATINNDNYKTVLVLFECGKYFLKYRITSSSLDTSILSELIDRLVDKFSPIDVVKKNPLDIGASIHIAPVITTDTSCLDAILVAVITKAEWVYENVDSLERISGFPSLYFEEQKAAIIEMLKKWESVKHNNSVHDKYFNDLLLIRDSGFLDEFICDQYWSTLLLPDNLKLDWDNYEIWMKMNNPTVKLTGEYFYLIGYEKSYKTEK